MLAMFHKPLPRAQVRPIFLHTFRLATHSEDDPWHTSSVILPAGQRHRLFSGSWHIVSILASLQIRKKHRACSDWEPRDGARETPGEPGAWDEPMCIPATSREAPWFVSGRGFERY